MNRTKGDCKRNAALGQSTVENYRGGSRRSAEGCDLIILPYLLYVFGQTVLSKQCRPRSDAAERGVWSGSTLFATHPAILHTFTGSKMDLLKRSTKKSVPNLSKLSHEKEILSQRGGGWLNPTKPLWIRPWTGWVDGLKSGFKSKTCILGLIC